MNNKITYHREGDYFIPDLYLPKQPEGHIGKYGQLRLNYLKKNKLGLYTDLILNGTLPDHLIEIDKCANKRVKSIINELTKKENVDENLKQNNQLEWVRCMNNIKKRRSKCKYVYNI